MEQFASNSRKRVKKLTDNEIIKALECCTNPRVNEKCPRSKFVDICNDGCIHLLMKQALNLINRQKAEFNELQHKIMSCNTEIERLELDNVHWNDWEVKCRAINEFAEKLPEIIPHFDDGHTTMECVVRAVKNLVKEMVGE